MLEITSLDVAYGRAQVLFDVSIDVGRGELVTVIGANGAGKTTLLLTVSGVLTPTAGEIIFDGERIDSRRPHEIVAMGLGHVPQGKELFPAMTVIENLELGAHLVADQDEYQERLTRAFEFFPRLSERARQRAGTLSGGEQQMLAIARALMGKPSVLLLDEWWKAATLLRFRKATWCDAPTWGSDHGCEDRSGHRRDFHRLGDGFPPR